MDSAAIDDVLSYWFGLTPEQWWRDKSIDAPIRDRFEALWDAEQQKPAGAFLSSPRAALAAVILFDQFPRNMFRDTARSFTTDALALDIAKQAIDSDHDANMSEDERAFLYMPFQHSEDLADQERGVDLFGALADGEQAEYAVKHRDVIARFGRFPHRNGVLGREPTPEERAAGDVVPW